MKNTMFELIDFHESSYKNFEEKTNKCIFYSIDWLKIIAETYKYKLKLLKINNSNTSESFIPFIEMKNMKLQKKLISIPFSDHTQIDCFGEDSQMTKFLQQFLNEYLEIEIKSKVRDDNWEYVTDNLGYTLELNGSEEEIFNSFHKTRVKQVIKKAEKNQLKVFHSTSLEAINHFYQLHKLTRRKLGVPVQPIKLFKKLWENIISQNKGFIGLVKYQSKIIASSIFLFYKDTITYKYSASHPNFLYLKPNHLMLWDAISTGIDKNFSKFDFGKCKKENTGLRAFKKGWNAEETKIYYSILSKSKIKHRTGSLSDNKFVKMLVRKTPDPFQKCLSYMYKFYG